MKKTTMFFALLVLMGILLGACAPAAAPAVDQPASAPPAGNDQPAQAQPTAQAFAPACQNSCAAPDVKDTVASDTYCVEKIPYQNVSVPPGTTFEINDSTGRFKCQDSGAVVNGKNIITCTGAELIAYDLKLTNTACNAGSLAVGTGQCQEGLGFDAANNCCAPVGTDNTSVTIKVNMGACPTGN